MSESPVRLLHLFVSLPIGGAESILLNTIRGLDPELYHSTVCCIQQKGPIGEEIEALGVEVRVLNKLQRGGWDRTIVDELVELIKREQIGLVHTHLYHANLYGRLAAKKAGVPVVASIHNTYSGSPKWHRRLINWYLGGHTDAIIAGSNEIRADILRWDRVPEQILHILPNSIDLSLSDSELDREQARARLDLLPDMPVLGTVGRLAEQKGHSVLLDAIARLKEEGRDVQLLLVGDGPLRQALEEQAARLQINDRIHLLGSRRDLGDLFRAMELFVMPSLWEGLSLAMLSAMAAGLPVVATRVGGVDEVLGDDRYGLTLPADDVDALVRAIRTLLDDPVRAEALAAAGRRRVRENYSDQVFLERLQGIYRSVLGLRVQSQVKP